MLPLSLDELIAQGHPVRIVNQVLDKINIDPLLKKYKGEGSSSFHPRMLFKVLVYSCETASFCLQASNKYVRIGTHYCTIYHRK